MATQEMMPMAGQSQAGVYESLKGKYSDLTARTLGRNYKTWGLVLATVTVLLVIFFILFLVYLDKYKTCEAGAKGGFQGGNLATGGNNPIWHLQMGDAGWGGPMHSTYQPGESRVWGGSAEGGHAHMVAPQPSMSCGLGGVSSAAAEEADMLTSLQGGDGSSAKNMSDDDLVRVMNGGSAF